MFPLTIDLADEAATDRFAEDVAACLAPGDVIALSGGLGVGKTTFARALIRSLADDPDLEVPSPTFTLAQSYALGPVPVTHFDLYRLASPDELDELGLEEALGHGAALVEWPERAGPLPGEPLTIAFAIAGDGRDATLSGGGDWQKRLGRSLGIRRFLDRAGWPRASRRHLQGDSSTRRYERIRDNGRGAVLMDWPPRGAPPADDRRAAFRARNVRAFVAVDAALRDAGLSAPDFYATDLDAGVLLMEDFGDAGILAGDDTPDRQRYGVVIEALAAIHAAPRPDVLPLPDGATHRLMPLSPEVLSADIAFYADWYLPHVLGRPPDADLLAEFHAIWDALHARLADAETSWVLFDVQSPNLFWLPEREGIRRIGFIDFQDMFLGPAAYDVASICQDMRVTVPESLETSLRDRYVALRRAANPRFDEEAFLAAYAILSVSRALKSLGVFARLADHFGKPRYLQHVPRLREYLKRSLAHPALTGYAQWYRRVLPPSA